MDEDLFNDGSVPPQDFPEDTWTDPYADLAPEPPEDLDEADEESIEEEILHTARACLAAQEGQTGSAALEMMAYILSSKAALDLVSKHQRRTWRRLSDVWNSALGASPLASVDFDDIPDLEAAGSAVQSEFEIIKKLARSGTKLTNPPGKWRTCVSKVQRLTTKGQAIDLARACASDTPDEDLMAMFRSMSPPTSRTEVKNANYSMTVADWEASYRQAAATTSPYRISSGYPTMDWGLTAKNPDGTDAEPFGSFAPGEFHVFGGATGNGKSAWARPLARNMAADLVDGWGFKHAQILYAFTEENAAIVLQAAGLGAGMPFHHLARNITLANVGSSRKRLVHAVWDLVIAAYHRSQALGVPIVEAGLPMVIFWDYIGGTAEAGEPVDTVAIQVNADLAMRGFAQWDPYAMETFSGENFSAYAGMPWPEGMEFFRPVVIAFGQFRKLADPVWYDPSNRSCALSDFVIENADGSPGWDVLPGDFRIPTQSELRGSGVLVNHATGLYTLHRSRPQKNPKIMDTSIGRYRLADDRARVIPAKVRNATDLTFFPMRFDSQPSGIRGQFYDTLAQQAISRGVLVPADSYSVEGDPILPPRPVRTPFDTVAY